MGLPVATAVADDDVMVRGWRRGPAAARRFGEELSSRCRERGRSAVARAVRITGATVAAYVVAESAGLRNPPPLIAALTAVLVVQATLASTLVNGVQRVLSVVAGVALAAGFVAVVGLTWWSLGILVAASILVGQVLRLGPHLVEVPISAMLVLGVGYAAGAETVGVGRIVETLIGAAVGVLVNVAFPPAVQTRYASRAVEKFAGEIAALLATAAAEMAVEPLDPYRTGRWLEDARRLNRHAPQVDRALEQAEESRRLNVRALGTPNVGRSLRDGLEALEHISVSVRTLLRSVHDSTRERPGETPDPEYADSVRRTSAGLMAELAAVVRAFGEVVRVEIETPGEVARDAALAASLSVLAAHRAGAAELLLDDPRPRAGLWELTSTLVTVTDRVVLELDVAEHALSRDPVGDAVRARRRAVKALERLRDTAKVHLIDPHVGGPDRPEGRPTP